VSSHPGPAPAIDPARQELARQVGERLRSLRQAAGMSLGTLAEVAGIGKGSLSEIENGARSATLGTLYALAAALGVPLAALLSGVPGSRVASPGVVALLLDVSVEDGWTVEVYRLRIEAGAEHRSIPHGPGVVEHLLVTSGRARVGRVGAEVEVGIGEAAQWVSDVPHRYQALGPVAVDSVLVIRSPGPAAGSL
jgi:transcriptional regulator with XRE-family HTH domain